jgi:hypothetical protein
MGSYFFPTPPLAAGKEFNTFHDVSKWLLVPDRKSSCAGKKFTVREIPAPHANLARFLDSFR